MKDESPPMLAIYLLLAFLSLQYASNLFNTNQFVYERKDAEYRKVQEQLTKIQEVLNAPARPETPIPLPTPEQKKPPVIVKKRQNNKVSRADEGLHADPPIRNGETIFTIPTKNPMENN